MISTPGDLCWPLRYVMLFFLILEHIGKTDKEIMAIMCVADVTIRSIRSRVNKKKKDVAR